MASTETENVLQRLAARVRAQEKVVEKTADVLIQVGLSEALKVRLLAEEEKLRLLRDEQAMASTPTTARKVSTSQVMELVREVEKAASKAPRRREGPRRGHRAGGAHAGGDRLPGRRLAQKRNDRPRGRPGM